MGNACFELWGNGKGQRPSRCGVSKRRRSSELPAMISPCFMSSRAGSRNRPREVHLGGLVVQGYLADKSPASFRIAVKDLKDVALQCRRLAASG
jgi:hypothetical protein